MGLCYVPADEGGDLTLWNTKTGEVVRTMLTELGELQCMAFSPDGRNIAAAGMGKVVRLWDVRIRQELISLEGRKGQMNAIAFSPEGNLRVSADQAGVVRIWRANSK